MADNIPPVNDILAFMKKIDTDEIADRHWQIRYRSPGKPEPTPDNNLENKALMSLIEQYDQECEKAKENFVHGLRTKFTDAEIYTIWSNMSSAIRAEINQQ